MFKGTYRLMMGKQQDWPLGSIGSRRIHRRLQPTHHLVIESRVDIEEGNAVHEWYGGQCGHSARMVTGIEPQNQPMAGIEAEVACALRVFHGLVGIQQAKLFQKGLVVALSS